MVNTSYRCMNIAGRLQAACGLPCSHRFAWQGSRWEYRTGGLGVVIRPPVYSYLVEALLISRNPISARRQVKLASFSPRGRSIKERLLGERKRFPPLSWFSFGHGCWPAVRQAKGERRNFRWGLHKSILDHVMCIQFTDVAQVAGCWQETWKSFVDRDMTWIGFDLQTMRHKSGDRGAGRDQRNRGQQSHRSYKLGFQQSRVPSEGYTHPVCNTCGRRHPGECRRAAGTCFKCGSGWSSSAVTARRKLCLFVFMVMLTRCQRRIRPRSLHLTKDLEANTSVPYYRHGCEGFLATIHETDFAFLILFDQPIVLNFQESEEAGHFPRCFRTVMVIMNSWYAFWSSRYSKEEHEGDLRQCATRFYDQEKLYNANVFKVRILVEVKVAFLGHCFRRRILFGSGDRLRLSTKWPSPTKEVGYRLAGLSLPNFTDQDCSEGDGEKEKVTKLRYLRILHFESLDRQKAQVSPSLIHPRSTKMYQGSQATLLVEREWYEARCGSFVVKVFTCQQVKIVHQRACGLLQPLEISVGAVGRNILDFVYRVA
ncbi:hypothetical protein Tco_0044958 [Tanacetum coccineum]